MIESGSYFNLSTGKRNDKGGLTMSFFSPAPNTVHETPVTEETKLSSNQDLTTINIEALSRLNEEVPLEIGSLVLQSCYCHASQRGAYWDTNKN